MRAIPFGKPMLGDEEKQAVLEVMESPILVHGPKTNEFEQDFARYTGSPTAVSVSSCTAAMHLAYFDLGIGDGDEVIVPAQTHNATAHVVEFTGAKPVFVDAEIRTGNIDINQIEENINERTKAISVVHFLGMPVDMAKICAIGRRYNLFVLEDCALAMGTLFQGMQAGLHGDVGCFSFYPVKHMTTAEGGMLITKHTELAERISRKKAFGVNRDHSERKMPGIYDVNMLGFNYRMNEIQSAIGIQQLKRMNGFLRAREENFNVLYQALSQIEEISLLQSSEGDFKSSYYCMSVLLNDKMAKKRFEIVKVLNGNGVGTSVYYPHPVPHLQYYREKYGYNKNSFPNAAKISYNSIALPVGPHLKRVDMDYIADMIKQAIVKAI